MHVAVGKGLCLVDSLQLNAKNFTQMLFQNCKLKICECMLKQMCLTDFPFQRNFHHARAASQLHAECNFGTFLRLRGVFDAKKPMKKLLLAILPLAGGDHRLCTSLLCQGGER